jgi:dihydroorotate dehydrogenase (NAD+) catalytic subunit
MEGLDIKLGNLRMETPLVAVSGVYGLDYERLMPSRPYIGAVVTKSVTLDPRLGNPEPRIVETRAGLLNAIGLQNPGIEAFIEEELPRLRILEVPVIASVAGSSIDEYVKCSALLSDRNEIHAIELNVSCPNIERGGIEFGCDMNVLGRLVATVRPVVLGKALIVKLTPNVTDIASLAQAAIEGGADVISLINTLRGMAIDLVTQKPKLGNRVGGLSGIGIHPVAVYMVHQSFTGCCRRAGIPIIGIGGVSNSEEALELILAGATCVGIGTAMFRCPTVFEEVAKGIQDYLKSKSKQSVTSLVGLSATSDALTLEE